MQGMADPTQKVVGVNGHLYARAFIIADEHRLVAIVNADIWAGTAVVKEEVLRRLQVQCPGVFEESNLLISGTPRIARPAATPTTSSTKRCRADSIRTRSNASSTAW